MNVSFELANLPDTLRRELERTSELRNNISGRRRNARPEAKSATYPSSYPKKTSSSGTLESAGSERQNYRMFAPQYAYGRHRGPAPGYSYSASVLIALLPGKGGDWLIPLTLRPPQMLDHAGQISLPGGRAETGESNWRTACREFGEELGCTTEFLQPIGQFDDLYVYASRHRVTPMLGFCSIRPSFHPNKDEVAELILLPLSHLLDDSSISIGTMMRGNTQFEAPGIKWNDHFIWGATAMILGEFKSLVLRLIQDQNFEPWLM